MTDAEFFAGQATLSDTIDAAGPGGSVDLAALPGLLDHAYKLDPLTLTRSQLVACHAALVRVRGSQGAVLFCASWRTWLECHQSHAGNKIVVLDSVPLPDPLDVVAALAITPASDAAELWHLWGVGAVVEA